MPPLSPDDHQDPTRDSFRRRWVWLFAILGLVFAGVAIVGAIRGWPTAVLSGQKAGKVSVEAYAVWGEFWASSVNAVVCGILAWFWQSRRAGEWDADAEQKVSQKVEPLKRWEWMVLIAMLGAAGALRWGRMDLSLYNDEAHTFRRYIAGHLKDPTGSLESRQKWRPVPWLDTLWLDQVGNNSMPCSILGRLGYEAWRKITHAPEGTLSEPAIRLQAWLGGMGSLLFLALLARRCWPGLALWWILILGGLHPWHVRYSTEARGYGLLLLGVSACFYFLARALEENRWRWWLGLGAGQFVALWSFPGAVYWLLVFEILLLLGLLRKGSTSAILRSLTGSTLGGMAALQWMLPTLPQLVNAMNVIPSLKGAMGATWWKDVLGGLFWGLRWVDSDATNPWNGCIQRLWDAHFAIGLFILLGAVVVSLAGMVLLCRKGLTGLVMALSGPLAILLSWVVMGLQGKYLHSWYVLYALPGLLLGSASWVYQRRTVWGRGLSVLLVFVAFLLAWVWVDGRNLKKGKEDLTGVMEEIWTDARNQKISASSVLVAGVYTDVDVYFPQVKIINNVGDLDGLVEVARTSRKRLYVTFGRKLLMEASKPDVLHRLENPEEFTPLGVVYGLEEEQFSHRVYALKSP